MQVTQNDIRGMAESLAEIHDNAVVLINHQARLHRFEGESHWDTQWNVSINKSASQIVYRNFNSWDELRAWARTQDTDFSETILIQEVA